MSYEEAQQTLSADTRSADCAATIGEVDEAILSEERAEKVRANLEQDCRQ